MADQHPAGAPTGAHGTILVVEDEPAIAALQRLYLRRAGFGVHVATDGAAGLDAARRLRPAAIVLDVGLPGLDGTEVCRRLRAEGDWTPVLFVTARDEEVDRVVGLELGADDYLTKPFSPRELVARVRAVLRRGRVPDEAPTYRLGPVTVATGPRRVSVSCGDVLRDVPLTVTEFDLLTALARRPDLVLTREQLLAEVWGYSAAGGTRTVDVHVAQLRAKLGPGADVVRTVRGVGYAAQVPPDPSPAERQR